MHNRFMTISFTFAMLISLPLTGCEGEVEDDTEQVEKDNEVELENESINEAENEAYPLVGESCDYFCAGSACNLKCEEDVIYRCQSDNTWHLEEDCAEQESICVETELDHEYGHYVLVCE